VESLVGGEEALVGGADLLVGLRAGDGALDLVQVGKASPKSASGLRSM